MAYYETYIWAWLIYLTASSGLYYVVVKLSKYWLNLDVRNYFRLVSAVVLFTPASHTMDGHKALAPAFIVTFGELLTNGIKASLQGLVPLLFALFVGAIVLSLDAFIATLKAKKQSEA